MKGIFSQKIIHETPHPKSPEHDLWVSVLSKAAHDAIYTTDWREARLAIAWFKSGNYNFRKVCEYAGRDPEYVHRVMELPIKRREKEMENNGVHSNMRFM
jgi:hypothetical protein